mmetsp:Transcript_99515/g.264486  ORF Transcript_99515/g.264486 Transcript_99515/m.264486 type:complete len:206 (+) Transcript_99515:500-1117(+)
MAHVHELALEQVQRGARHLGRGRRLHVRIGLRALGGGCGLLARQHEFRRAQSLVEEGLSLPKLEAIIMRFGWLHKPEAELSQQLHSQCLMLSLMRWHLLDVQNLQADTEGPRGVIIGCTSIDDAKPARASQGVIHESPLLRRGEINLNPTMRQEGHLQALRQQQWKHRRGALVACGGSAGLTPPSRVCLALAREQLLLQFLLPLL